MEFVVGILLGVLITLLLSGKTLKICIHHKMENVISEQTKVDLAELETKMFTKDSTSDQNYDNYAENITDVLTNINDLMGGSDRDGE